MYKRQGLDPAELREVLDEIQERSKGMKSLEEWFRHVDSYREKLAEKKRRNPDAKEGVSLLTMHGAKGLEFDQVFAVFPQKDQSPLVRQARYIAATRALHELHMYEVEK